MTDPKVSLLNNLEDFLTDYLGEDWEDKTKGELLEYHYRDAYDGEEITVEVERAYTDGKGWILVDCMQWNREDEYFNLIALTQHGADFDQKELEDYYKTEKHDDKLADTWAYRTSVYDHKGSFFSLRIYPHVKDEMCHLNITHIHYYRALGIQAKVYGIDQVKAFLEMRDLFFNLGWEILERNYQETRANTITLPYSDIQQTI